MNEEEKVFDTNDIMSCFKMSVDVNGIKRIEEYINKLQNNWDELKNIIEQDIRQCEELIEMCPKELRNTIIGTRSYEEIIGCNKHILSKMQELEGNNE